MVVLDVAPPSAMEEITSSNDFIIGLVTIIIFIVILTIGIIIGRKRANKNEKNN